MHTVTAFGVVMKGAFRFIGVLFVAGLVACGSTPAPEDQGAATSPEYHLGSGDRVRVTVLDQPNLTGEYRVDGAGRLAFPLIGSIDARGLSPSELEEKITSRLKPEYLANPSVSVEVVNARPFYVLGEVKNPGSYPYVEGITVLNAVAIAGGFTYRAREEDFYITRSASPSQKQAASAATRVTPGDVITVRERYF
ncbi:MAG: polysaccharide biosynthesis/export family protein [Alphaproteobacteria bacterium]